MKSPKTILATLFLAQIISAAGSTPSVDFTWPTNGQQIVTFTGLAGTAQTATGTVQQVTFSIYNQSTGQWWNGTNFQGGQVSLPVTLTGTNWVPASGVALPALCCGQYYQLTASATDTYTNTGTTNITVQADSVPPFVTFSPLANGQTVSNLSTIGGSVTDNFNLVASVVFSIHEQDINYSAGRWWNGTNFQNSLVTLPAAVVGTNWTPAAGVALPQLNSGQSYDLTVIATDTTSNSSSLTITVTNVMAVLNWDPGQTPLGTVVLQRPNTNGGNYWFKIIPQSPVVGVWRTALNVLAGQAGVYMSQGSPPNIYNHSYASANAGSNGFVLDASQFQPGQNWYILVSATNNAQWNLVTGDIFVYNLGTLATNGTSSTNATIGAEGMIFYQTTIPSTTLAWQLWLNGAPNTMFVKKSAAPDPASYDLTQSGQMLVVPPYLAGGTFNGSYFIGVSGNPGTMIALDSRQQPVTALPFSSLTNVVVTATNFPYVTYQVQVPVQQIAWQLNLMPTSGNPAIAVRRDLVPNEFRNDAFSETPQNVGASVTLVPPPPNSGAGTPGLSDGSWYVTIYSTSPYSCGFANANPVITPESYVFQATNDDPNRAGWRYYVLTNINQQLGSLGWQLSLANQVPGSEIAIRRNAVPGQWSYRNNDDYYPSSSLGYVDLSSIYGLLQQPGHQADIWYIGVYTPNQALGSFVLNGNLLTGQPMPFDGSGSSVAVANQPPGQWGFFRIDVPSDTNLLGWDVRLVGVSNGNPQMVVSRDTLPTGFNPVPYGWWFPTSTQWPSGYQWPSSWSPGWTGCGNVPMLEMGVGNPLQAGTYYIGVQDPNNVSSYTLQSRGIGLTNYTIAVRNLNFNGSVTNLTLPVGEEDYYWVTVPSNAPDWKLHLSATVGDMLLKVQRDYLPNSVNYNNYGGVYNAQGGQLMMKPGDEQWALLPYYVNYYATNLLPGTYYVLVASQGQNLTNNCNGPGSGWGTGSTSYTLNSWMEPPTVLPDALSYGNDLVFTNAQAGGETKFYQFNVSAGIASIEVRLENRVGNPWMTLNYGTNLVTPEYCPYYCDDQYGNYGGTNNQWYNGSLITIPNPQAGVSSLTVYGADDGSGTYPDASYVLRVRAPVIPQLSFSPELNSSGLSNIVSGTLADTEHTYYQVIVPLSVNGAPVLGWQLKLTALAGSPSVRVRQNLLPDNTCDTTAFASPDAIIVPPYLTPGTWYVDVVGSGSTTYTLTSRVITTNTLAHPGWMMPAVGQTNTAPGLALPFIGDSGVDTNGNPLPGDQGIDLKQGGYDYYAVMVPTNNAAVLRTELQAISGNPNLYLRVGSAPTLNHYAQGSCDSWDGQLVDRQLTGGTTEYGNWVPLNGRYETQLTNGLWVLAVQANGNANARYRLQLSCGNSVTNGLVQNLALDGGSYTNQNLNGGDWRYYRVQIPDPAPTNWAVTFSRSLGSARMFVRDTIPPGDGKNPADFSNSGSNPGPGSTDLQTWNTDNKNQGPYPRFDTPGTYNLTTPPLRPGDVYYLGFWSPVDTTFSVSSATNGGTISVTNTLTFYGGSITNVIPGYGTLLYRMDVPSTATRILFNASNSTDIVFSLEQGTIALAGGPAHWTSYYDNYSPYGNQANVSFNQLLNTPNNWPWLSGYSYYLTITNTSPNAESFSFTMSLPGNLSPFAFIAPTSVTANAPNPSVQVVWGVANKGVASASGNWYDTVWFSTNGVLDANSIDVGNFWVYNQTVPVGGSYWQTNNVNLPMSANGNYTLFVQVDAGNYIYEANLGDKVSAGVSGTFTLTPPDLIPVSVVAPATVTTTQPNPTIQVVWGVTNQGSGAALGGWYDRVWFSTNGVLDTSSIDLGDFYFNQGVPAGGNYSQTNSVTLPISLGGSYNYTLFVQVDIYNWIYESNKANNLSAPVQGTVVLDLPPQIVTQPVSRIAMPGANASFSVAAIGTPPLHYQWQLNHTNVIGATNAALTLPNVQPANGGDYLVVVTNAFGTAVSATASLVVANLSTNCTSAPAGLIGWWPGDGNANDVIGNNNGVLNGGVTFTSGKVGQAFNLDGYSGFISTANQTFSPQSFTLEFWLKTTTSQGGVLVGFGDSQTNLSGNSYWNIYLDNYGRLHFGVWNSGVQSADSAASYNDGAWHQVVASLSPNAGTSLYVDGALVANNPSATNLPNYFGWGRIGQNNLNYYWPSPPSSYFFNGQIDEVAVYNRALSFDEIASVYLAGSYGFCGVPPVLLIQPQSQIVPAGSNAVFTVNAVGDQPLYYQWQKNGVNLKDTSNFTGSTNTSLIITDLSSSDGGTFSVTVSNAYGLVSSTGAVLFVNVLQSGGFESGNFSGWTLSGNADDIYLSAASPYDHSGGFGLEAGPVGSLGYLSQTFPTIAGTTYLLSFWFDSQGGTPNEFLVSWNGNTLLNQTNIPAIGWTNIQFTVSATGSNTVLEFGFRNDPGYFGLDDISVSEISAPSVRLSSAGFSTNGGFQLYVYGQIGQAYTLQASTNLVNWVSLFNFTCTNSPMYVVDPAAKYYSQRFYRLAQGALSIPASPVVLGFGLPQPWTTNGLSLILQGPMGSNYMIQASTDLLIWLPITNFLNANSPLYFNDPQAGNYKQRFYRAVLTP